MTMRMLFSFILLITASTPLLAEKIGTIEEAIKATRDNQEPAYIKTLMAAISVKLAKFAETHVKSPKEKLAWLHNMKGVLSIAYHSIWHQHTHSDLSPPMGSTCLLVAVDAARDAVTNNWRVDPCKGSVEATGKAAKETAFEALHSAAVHASLDVLGRFGLVDDINRKTWRAAEWAVLNALLEHIDSVVTKTFQVALENLGERCVDNPEANPFVDDDYLHGFYKEHFGGLNENAMVFLTPWLVHSFSL